jgi:hypothetical protein
MVSRKRVFLVASLLKPCKKAPVSHSRGAGARLDWRSCPIPRPPSLAEQDPSKFAFLLGVRGRERAGVLARQTGRNADKAGADKRIVTHCVSPCQESNRSYVLPRAPLLPTLTRRHCRPPSLSRPAGSGQHAASILDRLSDLSLSLRAYVNSPAC